MLFSKLQLVMRYAVVNLFSLLCNYCLDKGLEIVSPLARSERFTTGDKFSVFTY